MFSFVVSIEGRCSGVEVRYDSRKSLYCVIKGLSVGIWCFVIKEYM